jgi:rhodanese-related sulfurtransferase/DNA-binding transcriptional ArsR family regulator
LNSQAVEEGGAMSEHNFKRDLFGQFARIGKALASGKRLEMLEFLAQGERSVEQLAHLAGLAVANTSQHLQQLRQVGLVTARKEGLYVYYRIAGNGIVRLLAALRAVGEEHLADVDRLVRLFRDSKDDLEPVPAKELWQRVKQGLVTVLDVRPPEEYAQGHIRGALNVPVTELKKRLHQIPADQEVVAYCRGPYCLLAYEAVRVLRKQGIKARRLEEGYPEWKSAGLPVEGSA